MDYRAVFQISALGMALEKRRVEVASLNLANMNASAPAGQAPYAPQKLVAEPVRLAFSQWMDSQPLGELSWQRPMTVLSSPASPRLAHDPGHPHADAQGYVRYPGVDHASEMVSVMSALRAYEANVAVATAARSMAAKALEIGGQG